jgi:hypothetical protein
MFCPKGRAAPDSRGGVLGDKVPDGVTAERRASAGGEQRVFRASAPLAHPDFEDRHALFGQRRRPLLPALARASDVRAGTQLDVLIAQTGELGDPQARFGENVEEGVV